MSNSYTLKQILSASPDAWHKASIPANVVKNFDKVVKCGTAALGAVVYASATEQKLVYHTCKSRMCPSCGHRAAVESQRQLSASLPDIPYFGVVFTMPDVLWPFFQENRHLLHDLPALAGAVIKKWTYDDNQSERIILVVQHTFGRHLNFNPHLHVLISAGGLNRETECWVSISQFQQDVRRAKSNLMARWRYAVITFLRKALKKNVLRSEMLPAHLKTVFSTQYARWWNIAISKVMSKQHFILYAARYVRRPPIAQYKIMSVADDVRFRTVDHKLKKEVVIRHSASNFVSLLAEHVPDHYSHAIRYFGLLAPRLLSAFKPAIFLMLGLEIKPRPTRLSWAYCILSNFGVDPLLDSKGLRMRRVGRMPAVTQLPLL